MANSSSIGAPATKYITPQPNRTKAACPKSGCIARIRTITTASRNDQSRPGGPPRSCAAAIIHAATTIKPGLRNSDGWMEAKPSEYQRVAPFPKSVPKKGSKASPMNAITKPSTARRRTRMGLIMEVTSMATRAAPPKIACRVT